MNGTARDATSDDGTAPADATVRDGSASPKPARVPSRAELQGRAAGATILSFFALAWTVCGSSEIPVTPGRLLCAVGVVCSLAAIVTARRLRRRAAHASTDRDPSAARRQSTGRRFGIVVAAEAVGIFAAVAVLAYLGHPELDAAVIATGVGLHFFPLAALFRLPAYHLTGSALCLAGVATLVLAPLLSAHSLWTALPGFGSALTLYVTAGYLLKVRAPVAS